MKGRNMDLKRGDCVFLINISINLLFFANKIMLDMRLYNKLIII